MFRKVDFMQWMDEFFQKKSNELQYSQTMSPKRMQKVTYDLSVAPTRPVKLAVPFAALIVSKIYSTATPSTDKAGTLKVMFDTDDDANVQNAIALYPNDSLRLGVLARQAFFTWSAQADTSVDIYVFPDIEVIAGTTKTQIVGSVTTVNTTADKYPAPSAIAVNQSLNGGGNPTYTLAAGKYAWVTGFALSGGAGQSYIEVSIDGGTTWYKLAYANYAATNINQRFERTYLAAGAKIRCTTNAASNEATAYIEVYDL